MPRVARVFGHNATLSGRIVARWFWGIGWLFLQDPLNGRLADVDTGSGQLVGDLRLAECGTEQLDFLNGIANETRESIHGCAGLNE